MQSTTQDSIYDSLLSLVLLSQHQVLQVGNNTLLALLFAACMLVTLIISHVFKQKKHKSLRNQTVLITGGASGIGRLMCDYLAKEGCKLVIWDIQQQQLDQAVQELAQEHGDADRFWGFVCDVSKSESVAACAAQVEQAVGTIDILINKCVFLYTTHSIVLVLFTARAFCIQRNTTCTAPCK